MLTTTDSGFMLWLEKKITTFEVRFVRSYLSKLEKANVRHKIKRF